jgi:hypothetical protein
MNSSMTPSTSWWPLKIIGYFPKPCAGTNVITKLKNVNLVHSAREGAKRVFFFSVSDADNYFKLKLDPTSLEWRLVELYTDG